MKRLILLLAVITMLPVGASAQAIAPFFGTGIADDSVGTREFWYPGWSRITLFPLLAYKVAGSSLITREGAIIYLMKNGRSADTIVVEQRVIHRPSILNPTTGQFIAGDTSWQAVTYMNMQTGQLDSTGVLYLARPLVKIQVYDLSSGAMIRLRTRTLRPSAERVTYRVF
jgi:hypothetical protein